MKPNRIMLSCFLVAGFWLGSIVTYMVSDVDIQCPVVHDSIADLDPDIQARPRLFNRGQKPDSTQGNDGEVKPYDEATAPPLGFEFPEPEGPVAPAPAPEVTPEVTPEVVEPEPSKSPFSQITDVFGSLSRLFNGEGDFSDIINIGLFALMIYGGFGLGGSDSALKLILGLFSKKGNFGEILEGALAKKAANGGIIARRRDRRRAATNK